MKAQDLIMVARESVERARAYDDELAERLSEGLDRMVLAQMSLEEARLQAEAWHYLESSNGFKPRLRHLFAFLRAWLRLRRRTMRKAWYR